MKPFQSQSFIYGSQIKKKKKKALKNGKKKNPSVKQNFFLVPLVAQPNMNPQKTTYTVFILL